MVIDTIFPGWVPFWQAAITHDIGGYYKALDEINAYDFDVLVAGHLTRLGTKNDVQDYIDFFADVLAGVEAGFAATPFGDVFVGSGVTDPTNPNAGNIWLALNEYDQRIVNVCEAYVLDAASRGRDWVADLGGLEISLRSQCWAVQNWVRIG